jgi:hypothetical protein
MLVIRKFLTDAATEATKLQDLVTKIESNPGVKILSKAAGYLVVAFEKDLEAIKSDPTLQKEFDALEAKVKADIEAVGNITVRQIVDFEINLFTKCFLALKKLFQLIFKK